MELESTVFKDGDLKSNTNAECHHHQISGNCPVKIKPEHTLLLYDQHQYFPPHLCQGIPCTSFLSGFPTKMLYARLITSMYITHPTHQFQPNW